MAQGALMCENYKLCADGISSGSIAGDPVALAVAAYNAGFGAVQRSGGMPSGGDYTIQTQPYVYKIMQRARAFEASPSFGGTPQIQVPTVQTGGKPSDRRGCHSSSRARSGCGAAAASTVQPATVSTVRA